MRKVILVSQRVMRWLLWFPNNVSAVTHLLCRICRRLSCTSGVPSLNHVTTELGWPTVRQWSCNFSPMSRDTFVAESRDFGSFATIKNPRFKDWPKYLLWLILSTSVDTSVLVPLPTCGKYFRLCFKSKWLKKRTWNAYFHLFRPKNHSAVWPIVHYKCT